MKYGAAARLSSYVKDANKRKFAAGHKCGNGQKTVEIWEVCVLHCDAAVITIISLMKSRKAHMEQVPFRAILELREVLCELREKTQEAKSRVPWV